MSNSNLKINEQCIKCGSCLGCGYGFLSSAEDGSIIVRNGTILKESGVEFDNLMLVCPVGAFEIDSSISVNDTKQIIKDLIDKLKTHAEIPTPTLKELAFKKEEYHISLPFAAGEGRYEYSNDSAANRAARSEFERAMYSQMDSIILKIITEYRVKHVKPYYTADLNEGSVYAKNNQKISEILQSIVNLSDGKLDSSFSEITVIPDSEFDWKMLNRGEIVADECISSVRSEMNFSPSDYEFKWDTDYSDVSCGTDWRGNIKFKERYCYRNLREAFKELANDILTACGYAHERMEDQAIQSSSWLVKKYNEMLQKVIDEKINQVEKVIL